jgi:peptidyl-prolyl cis-trans isomerase SurA
VDEEQVEDAVRQQMGAIREENPNYQELLKAQNTTERELRERYRKQIREQMLTQQVQQKLASRVDVSYRDVQQFLQTYRDSLPPEFGISHILIVPKAGDLRRAEARKKIDLVMARLKAGEDFEALARENSEDTGSAKEGGDLGFFGRGKMVPEFEKAAFALKPGEVGDVVESSFGFHVLKSESATADSVRVRHILVLLRPSEEDDQKAYRRAEEIKERALKGEKFADLARQYSEHRETAEHGGFLKFYRREDPPRDFADALAKMRLGEVAGPIKTEMGWHVIRVNDDRETLEALIRQRKLADLFEKTIDETRRKMYVDVRWKSE